MEVCNYDEQGGGQGDEQGGDQGVKQDGGQGGDQRVERATFEEKLGYVNSETTHQKDWVI
jgi:hypothetical protein